MRKASELTPGDIVPPSIMLLLRFHSTRSRYAGVQVSDTNTSLAGQYIQASTLELLGNTSRDPRGSAKFLSVSHANKWLGLLEPAMRPDPQPVVHSDE